MRRPSAPSAALTLSAAAALAGLAEPARAQQTPAAQISLEPIAADAALGGRARATAKLGELDTSLTAAVEHGGGELSASDAAWSTVARPASWTGDDLQLNANWTPGSVGRLSVEAGGRERRTRNFLDPLGGSSEEQLAIDQGRFLRLGVAATAGKMDLKAGAEAATTGLDTLPRGEAAGAATRLWISSRRIFAHLAWRPTRLVLVEAGQAAQAFDVGWRSAEALQSQAAYLTPSLALVLTPSSRTTWRVDLEETVTPFDPAQFAAYAQLATPGGGAAPQPDHGWRSGLSLEQHLPGGLELGARATSWRLASVTELGPVGAGEAPVGIGAGARQQLELSLAAPLTGFGLPGANLAGQVSWRASQVADPFTGARRRMSGETPYQAQLQLSGALAAPDLSWSLVAKADGPQSLYQMTTVTSLGATAGLGGALHYDAGQVRLSLELDNVVGGARPVTTFTYPGARSDGGAPQVERRDDHARAVRLSLRRGL
jgi:hypothetical protein